MNNITELLEAFSVEEVEEYIIHLKRKRLRKALTIIKAYKDDLDIFNLNSQIELYTILKDNAL